MPANTLPKPDLLLVGKVGAPHGVQGWVRVFSYTSPVENLLTYQPWWLKQQGEWRQMFEFEGRAQRDHLIVRFEQTDNRDEAALFTHAEIYVSRDQFPPLPEGEFYWSDLQGLTVKNLEGYCFGKVTHLLDTGANDVMFVKGEKEVCIPYLPDRVVKKVDLAKGEILVDWPEEV